MLAHWLPGRYIWVSHYIRPVLVSGNKKSIHLRTKPNNMIIPNSPNQTHKHHQISIHDQNDFTIDDTKTNHNNNNKNKPISSSITPIRTLPSTNFIGI